MDAAPRSFRMDRGKRAVDVVDLTGEEGEDIIDLCTASADDAPEVVITGERRTAAVQSEAGPVSRLTINKNSRDINKRKRSRGTDTAPQWWPDIEDYAHVVLVDCDNWQGFFRHLPSSLPKGTFVWGFLGGNSTWNNFYKSNAGSQAFKAQRDRRGWFAHPLCSKVKNAADFALCFVAGMLHREVSHAVHFTILSGDSSFVELAKQLQSVERNVKLLNPHKQDAAMVQAILNSLTES